MWARGPSDRNRNTTSAGTDGAFRGAQRCGHPRAIVSLILTAPVRHTSL